VIVTAGKREEDIRKVTTSVSALSAKKIEGTRTWGLGGLAAIVPNYNYQELGVPFQQIQTIRGIQSFSENPAVATYIDDVNNLDILANGFALTDIERIEVLRGPQGTLFGRNAMGGVVNIITKKPRNITEGFAEIGFGNLGLQRHSIGFKTPLVKNKLYFGINGLYQNQHGYLQNDTTGTGISNAAIQGTKVGGEENFYGNIYLKWLITDDITATLNFKSQVDKSNNTGFFVSQRDYDKAFANPSIINLTRIGSHERRITNTALTIKYAGDNVHFTSISARQSIGVAFRDIDFPGYYNSINGNQVGGMLPPQEVYSQEFRFNSPNQSSPLQYTAGIYGFIQQGFEPSTNTAYELTPAESAFFGFPTGSYIISRNKSNNTGFAAYGELNYQVSSKLKITAGFRYDDERKEAAFNGFFDAALINGVVVNYRKDTIARANYAAWSPKLALSYAIQERTTTYLSYTRGFRAGGINTQRYPANSGISQTFNPEYSDNIEWGIKTASANNHFSLSAAAFYIRWQDIQFFNLAAPFTFARGNLGEASSKGIEIESSIIPAKGLQVDASIGFNDASYGAFNFTRATGTINLKGNQVANAPKHSIFLGVQKEWQIAKAVTASIRAEVRNFGSFYTNVQNTLKQPGYSLVNTRAGIIYKKASLFVWGQNITNTKYLAYGTQDTSFGTSVRMAAPATYGITLSTKL
jgi:iron complex outermembrane receptor protein